MILGSHEDPHFHSRRGVGRFPKRPAEWPMRVLKMHFELSFGALLGRSSGWIPGQGHRGMQAFLDLGTPSCHLLGSLLLPSASCPHHETQPSPGGSL